MNEIFKIFLSMSVSGGLLILALLLGKRFLKDKLSRQWQYYIWLVVILRLLLPFGSETNLLGKTYEAVDQAITRAAPLPAQLPQNMPENLPAPAVRSGQNIENGNTSAEETSTFRPLQDMGALLTEHVWLIWLVAAAGLLMRKVTIYQGFTRYIKAGVTPVSDMEMLDRLSVIAEEAGVKKPVELYVNPLISSPLLTGFFRPCIVLPGTEYGETEFRYIVLHELIHYKRRDMFYKWLVQLTVCLHWFNPLVHLMSREITKACEFSCDEAVLAKTGGDSARDYGKTLLDAMAAVGKYRENTGAVTLNENKQLLKERLGAIMKFTKPSKAVRMATAALTLCVVLGAAFVGVYTMGTAAGIAQAARAASPGTPPDSAAGEAFMPDETGGFSLSDITGGFLLPFDPAGRPTLSLSVSSAAVNVLPAADGKISAEYNSDVYAVAIDGQGSDWNVSVSCKTGTNTNDETIRLYLPDVDYGNVSISVYSGHLTCGMIRSGNIAGSFRMASVFLKLPEDFSGALAATVDSGYFQLISEDDFRNTTTTIIDEGDWGEIYKPEIFQENGNTFTYTEGAGANMIQVRRKGSGVMGIYTLDALDSPDFPDEWKELWQNEGQGIPWAEDWWQNAWKEEEASDSKYGGFSSEAERCYEAGSLPLFQIEFSRMDQEEQDKWLDRIYADNKLGFWGTAMGCLEEDCALIRRYAEKCYEDGSIAWFSVLAMYMSEETLEEWLDKALEDGNWWFQSVLYNNMGRGDELDERKEKQEKEWEEAQKAEYEAAGIAMDGKNYYYQGQLVNIFLDIRGADKSFYTLDMNPAGIVNIRVIRDENDQITGVSYMTDAEVTELFGEDDREEDDKKDDREEGADKDGDAKDREHDDDDEGEEDGGDADDADNGQNAGGGRTWHPQMIPVNLETVADGEVVWLGEYTLSEGDRFWYAVHAETGNCMQVGFAEPEDELLNTVYYFVSNQRQEGESLDCVASMKFGPPAKPGTYKLFLRAKDGDLENVTGSISIGYVADAF